MTPFEVLYGRRCLKDRRRRPKEGGEWEPIKIHHRNLACIPNWTRRPSLLSRPGPHSYLTAIGPRKRVRNHSGNTNQSQQDHVRDQRLKSDRSTIYILTGISSNTWWTCSKIYSGRAIWTIKPRVLWSGDSRAIPISHCNNSQQSHKRFAPKSKLFNIRPTRGRYTNQSSEEHGRD
jgi:hypothetical protein